MIYSMQKTEIAALTTRFRQIHDQFGQTIFTVEHKWSLPDCLLFAVGWVETGLVNEVGDNGHGHGYFQLDDRSHEIPRTFDNDPIRQADTAGMMLADLGAVFDLNWFAAVAAYNAGETAVRDALRAGQSADQPTTGGDYSSHVHCAQVVAHGLHIKAVAHQPF